MLLRFLRFLRGYVTFRVSGRFPERFINITSRQGIRIWDVRRRGEGFEASMYMADYRTVRRHARGSGVRLRMISKHGLPTHVRRYRNRAGLFIGAFAFLLAVFVMSLFIWSVDITGLDTLSESEMRALLRDHGLYVGAFKPSLDYQGVARAVMLDRHEVGWMAVNVTGSYASVEVKEEYAAPEVKDVSTPCNIKAARDGTIVRIEATGGAAAILEGSGVVEGQLVVSGVVGDEETGVRLVHAEARVLARTCRRATFRMPCELSVIAPSDECVDRLSLEILGLRLPLRMGSVFSPQCAVFTYAEAPAPLDTCLPVALVHEHVTGMEERTFKLDDNSAKELLKQQAALYELFDLSQCSVTARNYELRRDGDVYELAVTYDCIEDIAVSEPIGIDEGTDLSIPAPTEAE